MRKNQNRTGRKTTLILLAALALITISSSCERKLEEEIYDFWGEDFFSSTERLNMGVRGVLECFSNQDNYGLVWMVYDCDTDISHVKGPGVGHYARDIGHYNLYNSHPWLEKSWAQYYTAIDRANFILAKKDEVQVENNEIDQTKYKQLIAEARFLRAMAYFDLIRLFGDVPYKETYTILNKEDLNYPRTDAQEIYEHICLDMEEALDDLLWHDEFPEGYQGRFSKGAGHAFLTRVYLFRAGWSLRQSGQMERPNNYTDYYQKALEHANTLIKSGKHQLNPSYERVFRNMCELQLEPLENIYEYQFYSTTGQKAGSSMMGTYNGPSIPDGSTYGRANSFINTNMFFYDSFAEKDLRKDVAVATWRIVFREGKEVISPLPRERSYTWAPGKWRRNWHSSAPQDPNNTNVNWVLLRYADVLLMKAEAENEINQGPTAEAIECLNQVKRRAYGEDPLAPNTELDYQLADFNKETFFEEIRAERARELCFEGLRRMDLIRWNKLQDALKETRTKFDQAIAAGEMRDYDYDGASKFIHLKHELYPIPNREVTETGNRWKQNPGYTK